MQRPGSAGCRVPPQSLTVPPLRAWGLFLAPTPQSLRFPTQASASVPQGNKISLASSERAAQKRRSTFASALGHHPPPHTPLELAEAVGKCRRHLREERRCHSPHPPRNRFLLIKTVYHLNLGTCRIAGDSPVLQQRWQCLTYFSGLFRTGTISAALEPTAF